MKVDRLADTLEQNGPGADSGNRFWYVMTFASWVMVPLIVAFVYKFKK